MSVFEYTNYKEYVDSKIRSSDKGGHGVRSKLADYVGSTSSYLSQVLNSKPHLTLEQSEEVNRFFEHTELESHYFLLLVQYNKAGTHNLKNHFRKQIEFIRNEQFNFKKRLKGIHEVSKDHQHEYYSTWFYSAIHVMLSIPEFSDSKKIATHLNLPLSIVNKVIEFLKVAGLVEEEKGKFKFTNRSWHLEKTSPFIQRHHINWRSQALQSVEKNLADDLHYSNVMAFAKKDSEKVKEILVKAVSDIKALIRDSPEEKVYVVAADFFGL